MIEIKIVKSRLIKKLEELTKRQAIGVTAGLLALALVFGAGLTYVSPAHADTHNSDAVVNCNEDNPLGHGGDRDNPPACAEDGNPMPEQNVNTGDWVEVYRTTDRDCVSTDVSVVIGADSKAMVDGVMGTVDTDNPDEVTVGTDATLCAETISRVYYKIGN